MSPTNEERAARRKRAQADARKRGNERAASLQVKLDSKEPPSGDIPAVALAADGDAESKSARRKTVIESDTAAAQAARAVAKIEAAEHARRSKSTAHIAPSTPAATAARREPRARARTVSEPPVPIGVEQAVEHMQVEHLQCRDFGHSWRPYSARWMPTFNQYESQLLCARCKTIRTRFMSRTGALLDSKYDYADGYTIKGLGRLSGNDRNVIRLHSILQVLPPDTASDD